MKVTACPVPQDALLQRYVGQGATYTDCFSIHLPRVVEFEEYVTAFYTTRIFRLERFILWLILRKPSTDAEAAALAQDQTDTFAAWQVEARAESQLLLCDLGGKTRSWICVKPANDGTDLLFGSAVVTAQPRQSALIRTTLSLHILYSKILLSAARRKLLRH